MANYLWFVSNLRRVNNENAGRVEFYWMDTDRLVGSISWEVLGDREDERVFIDEMYRQYEREVLNRVS